MEDLKIFDIGSDELYYLIDSARTNLAKNNIAYKKLQNEISEIIEKYPIIDKIYYPTDDELDRELTKEECKMLQKVFDLHFEISTYEDLEIFFLGGKIAYSYFRKMGIIK